MNFIDAFLPAIGLLIILLSFIIIFGTLTRVYDRLHKKVSK